MNMTCIRPIHSFKTWLLEMNRFDHVNTLTISEQRIATRIYNLLLLVAVIILLTRTSLSVQEHTVTIESPSLEDFESSQSNTTSCPCRTITIPHRIFLNLQPEFHPICSSEFVERTWSDALFWTNASLYLPADIRSTLSAQFQLLSSLCSLAQQIVVDETNNFLETQFISTQVISNDSLHIQADALTTSLKDSIPSSLLRLIDLFQNISRRTQVVAGIAANAITSFTIDNQGEYHLRHLPCTYTTVSTRPCQCNNSSIPMSAIDIPMGLYEVTMPKLVADTCVVHVPTNGTSPIFNGLYSGYSSLESLLISSLKCLYDIRCLQILQRYSSLKINVTVLTSSSLTDQFNQNSTVMEMLRQLFVNHWNLNVSYNSYFAECAPMRCSYRYSHSLDLVYILTTLLAFYSGLTIILELLVPLTMKYWHFRKDNHDNLKMKLSKLKQSIVELNIFAHKNKLTAEQQRIATRIFFVLFVIIIVVLTIFSMVINQLYTEQVNFPTQKDFERLVNLYPNTLSCPCSQMIIPQKEFIHFEPSFHGICSSKYVSLQWVNTMLRIVTSNPTISPTDMRFISTAQFPQLNAFCNAANQTIEDLLFIFNKTSFISLYALSNLRFNLESNRLITLFQQLAKGLFFLQIKFIEYMFRDNQIYFGVYSSGDISITLMNNTPITYLKSNNLSFDSINCSCILNSDSCFIPSGIYVNSNSTKPIVSLPTFLFGCSSMESLFHSTLECFYNQTCLNALQPYIPSFTMTSLTLTSTSQYTPQTQISVIIENLFIEQWNPSISFANYYSICAPQQCTYTYEKRENYLYLMTTFLSLFSGLKIVLRILSPLLVSMRIRLCRHHENEISVSIVIRFKKFLSTILNYLSLIYFLPSIIWNYIISLNLFKYNGQDEDQQRIRIQKQSTRLYLTLLLSTLVILGIYRIISIYEFRRVILNPSIETFEHLNDEYKNVLSCPCNELSMNYSELVSIEYTFHPICLSDFIEQDWFNQIANRNNYAYVDFRRSAVSFFQILRSLCQLANMTLVNSLSSFLTQQYLSTNLIHSIDFTKQIQTTIEQFQSNTRSNYIRSLRFIRDAISENALITIYSSSWKYQITGINPGSTIFTYPVIYQHENGTCSCGQDGDCSQPAAIYSENRSILIEGIRVGCYPLNSVLQSTLQCFYSQQCLHLLTDIFNITQTYTTFSNQSNKTDTINSLANQLFIEDWQTNITYEKYFQICHVTTCSYTYSERANVIYAFTTLIGLFSGLNISLKIFSPIIVKLFHRIKERFHFFSCQNKVLP